MLDRYTGMLVFQKVATLGSLSAAARVLGMSQTMATKHLAAVEDRLGSKLVHRTTRRLSLTEPGRAYLEDVDRILADVAEAERRAGRDRVEVQGTLRLNVPVSYGLLEIAPLLPGLARRHPTLTVELGLNDRRVDLLEEGWDMAIRIGSLPDKSLVARRLAPSAMRVAAAPDYLAARGTPRRISDLKSHDCLGYTLSRMAGADQWSFGAGGRVKVKVSGSLKANNGDVLVAAAIAGQGIIYQPLFLVRRALAEGRLLEITLDHPPIAMEGVYAVYPSDRQPPAKVRAAIDYFAESLRELST
ncbi:MAG: LysR family transcriptional regulator [Hyphomicrobium sp.]|nr:LysR family transcriptional regulator [Hyphomicrobium sp.]